MKVEDDSFAAWLTIIVVILMGLVLLVWPEWGRGYRRRHERYGADRARLLGRLDGLLFIAGMLVVLAVVFLFP